MKDKSLVHAVRGAEKKRSSGAREARSSRKQPDDGVPMRERILNAAVALLVEQGTARTSTLEVQKRAGTSRGALLHYFPTHADLLSATVEELVRRNERSARETAAKLQNARDIVERAIRALAITMSQPAHMAELELWAVARTDEDLRSALQSIERRARPDNERVMRELFGPLADHPAYETVVSLTVEFLRGLTLSGVLRKSPMRRQQQISQWVRTVHLLLEHWR